MCWQVYLLIWVGFFFIIIILPKWGQVKGKSFNKQNSHENGQVLYNR